MMLYMRKIQYILIEEQRCTPELGRYRSFGIMAARFSLQGAEALAYVPDVSTDRALAAALARRCTRSMLSPDHLRDFILDTLGT